MTAMTGGLKGMQERWDQQREERRQEIIATMVASGLSGCRMISCVSFYDPRNQRRINAREFVVGETRRVVLTNAPIDPDRFGRHFILVGHDSQVVDEYEGRVAGPNDVNLVIFPSAKVREP